MAKSTKIIFPTSSKFLIGGGVLALAPILALIIMSSRYRDNYYNSLNCDIYDVTPIDSAVNDYTNSIYYFFQYSYRAQNCSSSFIYTIDDSNYYDIIDSHDEFLNITNATCYALKNEDQCDVSMWTPTSGVWFLGILLGSLALFFDLVAIGSCLCLCVGWDGNDPDLDWRCCPCCQ